MVYGAFNHLWELFWTKKAKLKVVCNQIGLLEKIKKQIISQWFALERTNTVHALTSIAEQQAQMYKQLLLGTQYPKYP